MTPFIDGQILTAAEMNAAFSQSVPSTGAPLTKTASYAITSADYTIRADAAAGAIVFPLPAVPANGERHVIKKVDASINTVTVSGNGINIDGAATAVLPIQYASISVFYDAISNTWNAE